MKYEIPLEWVFVPLTGGNDKAKNPGRVHMRLLTNMERLQIANDADNNAEVSARTFAASIPEIENIECNGTPITNGRELMESYLEDVYLECVMELRRARGPLDPKNPAEEPDTKNS